MLDGATGERGFTLMELMIAVAIIGILVAIAYPSYQEQVRKSRRAEAAAALLRAAQNMERFYTANNVYTTNLNLAGIPSYSGQSSGSSAYAITAGAGPTGSINSSFELRATPAGAFTDPKCNQMTLNSMSVKGVSGGTETDPTRCW